MGSRKLIRDCFISKKPLLLLHHFRSSQHLHNSAHTRLPFFEKLPYTRLPLITPNGYYSSNRQFSVFNEFSNKIKGEVTSNKEFQQSVKELKNKAEELKGVREDLKVRVKQKTEQLHKQVDGVWTEAEETAKKVSANVKEKISAAKEEVKESLGYGKQESSSSTGTSNKGDTKGTDGTKHPGGEHQSEPSSGPKTFFDKFRSSFSSTSPKVTSAFQKLKEAKVADLAKKSIDIVKEELSGKSNRRRRMQYSASSSTGETSDRTEIVFVPTKQSPWSKKWEALKEKMQGNPIFKRATKLSEPVVTKSQELAEDLQERWETSDSPVVHKIQDINDRVFGENDNAMSFKEIRRCDPSFSLPEFVAEVQEVVRPVLNAYIKGDFKILAKYCSKEIIERCKAEHEIAERHGIFFHNKILHISEMEVMETKMMGTTPVIILRFQTQQIYCVRDRQGSIKEGGKDTIQTVYYAWAMQLVDPDEVTEDSIYAMWRLRDMQQQGIAALI